MSIWCIAGTVRTRNNTHITAYIETFSWILLPYHYGFSFMEKNGNEREKYARKIRFSVMTACWSPCRAKKPLLYTLFSKTRWQRIQEQSQKTCEVLKNGIVLRFLWNIIYNWCIDRSPHLVTGAIRCILIATATVATPATTTAHTTPKTTSAATQSASKQTQKND